MHLTTRDIAAPSLLMTKPLIERYFVCIGAQKSGTTWLARVLSQHPNLFVTPVKEIHYFDHIRGITKHLSDSKRRSRYRKYYQRMLTQWHRFPEYRAQWSWYRDYMRSPIDDAWYASLFRHRGNKAFAGEVTPEYAIIGRDGLEHIRRLAPDARVMFIMRNPITRAWSQVLHHCRAHNLDAGRQTPEALIDILRLESFRQLSDYCATIDDMRATFAADQVKVLFYEDMHRDRQGMLEEVCNFIGVRADKGQFVNLGRRYNRSQEGELPAQIADHMRTLYRPIAEGVRQRVGRIPHAWAREFGL
jgi:hypothetical protein